jgi:hypothetical protein
MFKITSGDCNIFQQATSNITKNEIIYFKTKNYVRFYYHSLIVGIVTLGIINYSSCLPQKRTHGAH